MELCACAYLAQVWDEDWAGCGRGHLALQVPPPSHFLRTLTSCPQHRSSPHSQFPVTSEGGGFGSLCRLLQPQGGEQRTLIPSRNLLRSPNPEGINIYEPAPPTGPTQKPLEALGNFRGWHIRTENLQQNLSWTVKQQCVDLLAEGLWEELLDDEQPHITVMDWYEDSRLDVCVYELHVWLLAADRRTVIAQHHVAPRTSGRGPPGRWVQVSHVFRQYGPGVRFVHFLHKSKNRLEHGGLRRTRVTDSSVSVQFRE
nr:F-box only protein 50 [Camelus bactrianus]